MKTHSIALVVALCFACGGADAASPSTTSDAAAVGGGAGSGGNAASDGFVFDADGRPEGALALGRCVLEGGVGECTGQTGEAQQFVPLTDDDAMQIVLGPQGSFMLVLMLRTQGVDGGDPDSPASPDNPSVEVQLRSDTDDSVVTRFRGRVVFEPAPGAADELESSSAIFVVVDGQEDNLVGRSAVLEAVLQDRFGERRRGLVRVRVES